MAVLVKLVAILTVLTANVVVVVCACLLAQLANCTSTDCNNDTRYTLAVVCTSVLCVLVLITATLDNVSWWSSSFPDAFMSTTQANQFLDRLSVTNPGCKVTIQQDFFILAGSKTVPKLRRKSREMYKPRVWLDNTQYSTARQLAGAVIKLRLEVSPADREARDDLDKFVQEMIMENSSGEYDRKLLTGLSIEARIPKLSLFQGCKIPQISLENREDAIALPLSSGFHKIVGEPVRIFVYSESYLCRSLCPALFSLKRILFLLILLIPVLGTVLSVVLADNTKQLTVRKRFSRRPTVQDLLEEGDGGSMGQVVRLLPRLPILFPAPLFPRRHEGVAQLPALSPVSEFTSIFDSPLGLQPDDESTGGSSHHEQAIILEETFVTESTTDSTQSLAGGPPPPYSSLPSATSYLAAATAAAAPYMGGLPDYLDILQQSSMDMATAFGSARETDMV